MSYYGWTDEAETVDVIEDQPTREVRCMRCRGSGLVEVHDQETDCIDCEGMGSVLIPL